LFKINKLRHYAIVANNLNHMIDFYIQVLDFKIKKRFSISSAEFQKGIGIPNAEANGAHLVIPNSEVELELIEFKGNTAKNIVALPANTPGIRHIAFLINDLNDCYNQLKLKGIEFLSEPVTVKEPKELAGIKFVYFRDPEGNIIELSELP
jgi:glyoxylase I family protein